MKCAKIKLLSVFVLMIVVMSFQCHQQIQNYSVIFGTLKGVSNAKLLLVLRRYEEDSVVKFLCVNPYTLQTSIVSAKGTTFNELTWIKLKENYKNTPYIKTIQSVSSDLSKLQDAGITHALPSERGINLTIDLCPSKKPLDRSIFTTIINEFNKIEEPAPMAISVSGFWMNDHQEDLNWLKQKIKEGKISVDWINHSYSHRYNKELPLVNNFLLEQGTDMNYEILENEKTMIKNGLTPSVMFRFPGLVSDKSVFQEVTDYGLIPVGSDAWLAKNQSAQEGSVVLIHGNGNEPLGVEDFKKLIQKESTNIKNKNWMLYDLRESIDEEE